MCLAAKLPMAVAILASLAFLPNSRAQQNPCGPRTMRVTVEDEKGQPQTGLGPSNFIVTLGKQSVPVVTATPDQTLGRVVILLDISRSMRADFPRRASLLAAGDLANRLTAASQVSLVVFDEKPEVVQGLTDDHSLIIKQLASLSPLKAWRGATAVYDSVIAGIDLLSPAQPNDAIVLISDGGDSASHARSNEAEEDLLKSGVKLYLVGIVTSDYSHRITQIVDPMSAKTGGKSFWLSIGYGLKEYDVHRMEFRIAKDYRNIPEIADVIVRELLQGYLLQLSATGPNGSLVDEKLKVAIVSDQPKKKLFVRYPQTLPLCK